MNLRDYARDKGCQVRLPGICNGDPATTVLAHFRMAGICGTGLKPPDLCGSWACANCHDECDRRTRKLDGEYVRLAFAEGVMRTLHELDRAGFELTRKVNLVNPRRVCR